MRSHYSKPVSLRIWRCDSSAPKLISADVSLNKAYRSRFRTNFVPLSALCRFRKFISADVSAGKKVYKAEVG